jgi:hypothetical protein
MNQMTINIHDELVKIADQLGGDHAAVLRKIAGEINASAAGDTAELSARQVRMLANGAGPRTMLQAIHAAAGNPDRIQGLQNLHARARRLGFDIPADSVITVDVLDAALTKGHGTTTDKIALKTDLLRHGMIAAA